MRALLILLLVTALAGCQTTGTAQRGTELNPISKPKGSAEVRGAVLFVGGASGYTPEHHANRQTPDILYWLEGSGFDVYRLDLSASDQSILGTVIDRARAASMDLRARGYKRVYLVGQSAGGFAALTALMRGNAFADGAIAFAPGVNARETVAQQIAWHQEALKNLAPDRRVAMFFFNDDELFGPWQPEAVEIARRATAGRQDAMVRVPSGVSGHLGFNRTGFARAYGECLSTFLVAEKPDGSVCPP